MTKPLSDLSNLPFGRRLRAFRNAADLTQGQLAERLGTTKATVSKLENSVVQPTFGWAERIAKALDLELSTVLIGYAAPANPSSMMVPVIGMIAAGNWREAVQISDEHIPVANAKPHMFALRIDGDSIDRIAPEGSFVTIDPTDPNLMDGALYAVQNGDGEATIKRFRRGPDRLEPDSSNGIHRPIVLGSEPITVIGRATSVTRSL